MKSWTLSLTMTTAAAALLCQSVAAQNGPPALTADTTEMTLPQLSVSGTTAFTTQVNDPQQVLSLGKTGTKLEDLPSSVQVIPSQVLKDQGATTLAGAINNASGISNGGTDGFGISDNFLIRGLNARVFNDGFDEGDQRNGIPNALNGVERVEILEGPGSALFGSGPPGGTINLVHFTPSSELHYGAGLQVGSFGAVSNTYYVTGPTGVDGLNYRVDGMIQHEDGFRGLSSGDYEIRPAFDWTIGDHKVSFSVDARRITNTPDPQGLIYLNGTPIKGVSETTKYSSPLGFDRQDMIRATLGDAWTVSDYLTVNSRFEYDHRNNSILRNSDGGTVTGASFTGRQLRQQTDHDANYDFQLEPVWKFRTGPIQHTLLTGFEAQYQTIATERATADLPSIANIFAPVIPETSVQQLNFLRNATHSGAIDDLTSTYLSLYATDQIDLTEKWKLRLGARQDWYDTTLTPQIFVPGRFDTAEPNGQLFQPGVTYGRRDAPVSWNVGTLYKVLPGVSPYVGVSKSTLANFSSEATQNGVVTPERALEYEGGVKLAVLDDRVTLNVAAFDVKRSNVFTLLGDTPVFNDQRTDGVEADLSVQPIPDWKINANGTTQHAVLTDNPSNPAATGKRPAGVPAKIFNLWTTYDFSLAGLDGFQVGVGVNYRDKIYANVTDTNSIPSYVTLNAVLAYKQPRWDLSLGLRNITDERYFVSADGAGAFVGEPLSVFAAAHIHY
jgi:iron complex outermembrane receptor protein